MKGKQRPHYWKITHRRYRREYDGTETPMTSEVTLVFPDKQLYEKVSEKQRGTDEPLDLGGWCIAIRKGAIGILDALLASMRQASKAGMPKKKKAA